MMNIRDCFHLFSKAKWMALLICYKTREICFVWLMRFLTHTMTYDTWSMQTSYELIASLQTVHWSSNSAHHVMISVVSENILLTLHFDSLSQIVHTFDCRCANDLERKKANYLHYIEKELQDCVWSKCISQHLYNFELNRIARFIDFLFIRKPKQQQQQFVNNAIAKWKSILFGLHTLKQFKHHDSSKNQNKNVNSHENLHEKQCKQF